METIIKCDNKRGSVPIFKNVIIFVIFFFPQPAVYTWKREIFYTYHNDIK